MLPDVNITKLFPAAYKAQAAVEDAVEEAIAVAGIDRLTVDLVKLRASQINGCAFCLRMHTQDALKNGETTDRLAVVAAWWESQYFTPQEQAALTITEQITNISDLHTGAPPKVDVASILDDKQIAALTWLAIAINAWNRIAISSHYPVAP